MGPAGGPFTLPEVTIESGSWVSKTDANCPSAGPWWEAHFKINLSTTPPTPPKTAYIVAEYQDTPSLWTVDIGDSPTDNGFGGGSDSRKAAEVQVVDQLLSVFDDNTGVPGQVDNMLTRQESLNNGSLKFTVTDQTLTIGPPWTRLWTPVTKLLYTLPDPAEDPALCPGKSCIYAAFNHVIDTSTTRTGCGVRSVTISIGN